MPAFFHFRPRKQSACALCVRLDGLRLQAQPGGALV